MTEDDAEERYAEDENGNGYQNNHRPDAAASTSGGAGRWVTPPGEHGAGQPAGPGPLKRGPLLTQRPLQPDYDRLLARRAGRTAAAGGAAAAKRSGRRDGGVGVGSGGGGGEEEEVWGWEWDAAWDRSVRPPWIIPARALGEGTELRDESSDEEDELGSDADSENAEDVGDCCAGGTGGWGPACCRRSLMVSWSHLVATCQAAIRKPAKASDLDGEGAANTIAAVAVKPMGFRPGCRVIAGVLLWDRISCFSRFRSAWDILILNLLIYIAFVTPYVIGFAIEYSSSSWQGIVELTVNGFFMLDIYFNFRTTLPLGYDASSRNQEIKDRRVIVKRYLMGWFALDVLAALPWAQMTDSLGGYMALAKVPRLIRLARLAKLLRLLKLAKVLQTSEVYRKWETRGSVALARVSLYVLAAILGLHLSACAWMFVAEMENSSLEGTWVDAAGLLDANNVIKYVTSLYFVVITYTTVGYGDIAPVTTAERVMTCLGMMVGVVMLGYIVSTANTIMGTSNKYDVARNDINQRVEDFLNSQPLPSQLAAKVKAYYGYVAAKPFNDEGDRAFVAELPADMRSDVLKEMHAGLISRVPLFKALFPAGTIAPPPGAPAPHVHPGLVLELVAVLKLEFYTKGDCVVMEGGWDTEMYFVTEGLLSVRQYRADNAAALTMTHTLSREDFAVATGTSLPGKVANGAQAAAGTFWSGLQHAGAALFGGGGEGGGTAAAAPASAGGTGPGPGPGPASGGGGAAGGLFGDAIGIAAGGRAASADMAMGGGPAVGDYDDTLSEGAIEEALDAGFMPWRNIPPGGLQAPSVQGNQILAMYVRWMEPPPAGTWLEHWPKRHRPRTSSASGGGTVAGGGGGAGAADASAADSDGGGGAATIDGGGAASLAHLKHSYSAPPGAMAAAAGSGGSVTAATAAGGGGGKAAAASRAGALAPQRVTEEGDDAAVQAAVEDAVAGAEAEAEAAAASPFDRVSAFASTAAQAAVSGAGAAGAAAGAGGAGVGAGADERPSVQFGPLDPLVQVEELPPGVVRQATAGLGIPDTPRGGAGRGSGGRQHRGIGGHSSSARKRRHWRMRYDDNVQYKHVRTIKRDGFFGEYSCLTGCPRTASVVAKGMCELYCLARADLAGAMGRWPGLAAAWQEVEAFGEAERHKLRAYLKGGHAHEAVAAVHDLSSALGAMALANRGAGPGLAAAAGGGRPGSPGIGSGGGSPGSGGGGGGPVRDPRVMNSEMRYQAFLRHFQDFQAPVVAAAAAAASAAEAGGEPAAAAAAAAAANAAEVASASVAGSELTPRTCAGTSVLELSPRHHG
ncbi:hypothetical protein HYH02_008886 [Chlamydomonas schloesseri]|uniref:Cyclic nucleotide-binding domain-containing protein n=1 Tax=Chlamydomonas schloesseri TaxID=2026947 RepID=A0A835WCV4_9CHLO|nr:hypothetical protein HYH02_008886 [Chlamydomonas schloesseri]|eukprot:KAG2445018.1 hypothetical protein HYH02_008886 [Chlamydomonas schloesseri]